MVILIIVLIGIAIGHVYWTWYVLYCSSSAIVFLRHVLWGVPGGSWITPLVPVEAQTTACQISLNCVYTLIVKCVYSHTFLFTYDYG